MARLKRSIGRFPVHAATGVVLLALIALAVPLRLSSTREVSAVQLERTQRLLNDATRRFVEDFDREITRAVIYFAISHSDSETRVQRQLVKRLEHWRENSPHPQLVTGLSWQRGKRLEPRALMSLDSTTGVLLPV
ncbi:MAG TPA: hypothetical protein VEK15_02610, partial [Vicinamibacteria bacterium]|nr:hypothetical protein [Vicinamibacteria bacterium]